MVFQRLIWAALATAVVVGSVQTGVQRWQAAPLILAAEVYEEQKAEAPKPAETPAAHVHAEGTAPHEHEHGAAAKEWEPANGAERIGWTWVANMLHAFSMALLVFAVMGVWLYQRGGAVASLEDGPVHRLLLSGAEGVAGPDRIGRAHPGGGDKARHTIHCGACTAPATGTSARCSTASKAGRTQRWKAKPLTRPRLTQNDRDTQVVAQMNCVPSCSSAAWASGPKPARASP